MVRILTALLAGGGLLVAANATADEAYDRVDAATGLDFSLVSASGYESWVDGGAGKLRYSDDGFYLSRAFVDVEARLTDTLHATIVMEAYGDGLGTAADLTEAYLEWKPVPRSPNRYRVKLGAFYPRLSLENVERGWSNPYLFSSSAINTWIAEELRSVGLEVDWSRKPPSLGGRHEFSVQAAVFQGNDPAGTLITWKGWSIHDRQTRFSDELPLPDLPAIGPDGVFRRQDPYTEPVREIDNASGYHVSAEWRYRKRLLVRAMVYDNKADPAAVESGQYGWTTKFEHLGIQASLPGQVGLIGQWLSGTTIMGRTFNGAYPVDVGFESYFVLLTRPWNRHRVSLRYDSFAVDDYDFLTIDDNAESGHGWTAGYQVRLTALIALGAEYLRIHTDRPAFEYAGLERSVTEEQLHLTLQLRF